MEESLYLAKMVALLEQNDANRSLRGKMKRLHDLYKETKTKSANY